MEYVKKTWETGDTITSAALNNIENALAAMAAAQEPLDVNGTMSVDGETGKSTLTTNKTAAELYAAIDACRAVRFHIQYSIDEDVVLITDVEHLNGKKIEFGDDVVYDFILVTGDEDGISFMYGKDFAADDTVILAET